jgi:hypothetical protein
VARQCFHSPAARHADVDGAAEEGTPFIPGRGMQRISFVPGPAGLCFYHTHVAAGADLSSGLYTGQVGPVYIEPRHEPGAYDREVFLTLKEFVPYLNHMEMTLSFLAPRDRVREMTRLTIAFSDQFGCIR